MSNITQIEALIYGIQFKDPRLADALRLITDEVKTINNELFPIVSPGVTQSVPVVVTVTPLVEIRYQLYPTYIYLNWDKPGDDAYSYEVRRGAVWATADRVLITQSLSCNLTPLTVGTHTFRIKVNDILGNQSAEKTVDVIIPALGNVVVTFQSVEHNVLFYWTAPTSSFTISHYELYRTGVLIGEIYGTFTTYLETAAGTYAYAVVAVDIAGNRSSLSAVISVTLTGTSDFVLVASQTDTAFAGTKVNASIVSGGLILPVDADETWTEHFVDNSFASPAAQITAGYPVFIQPTETTASYQKVFDFGTILTNTTVTISYLLTALIGTVTTDPTIEVSDDNITYSTHVHTTSYAFASARYVRVTLYFTPTSVGHDLALLESLTANLSVMLEQDGGSISALSSDATGTVVLFNKSFLDVVSITLTPLSFEPTQAIYDFTDIPNPTQFKVLVYDSTGNRISKTVSWKARGVV